MGDDDTSDALEWKEAFALNDVKGEGKISSKELGRVMRACGKNPTEKEVSDFSKEVESKHGGSVDFQTFLTFMTREMESGGEDELRAAFSVFDHSGGGSIPSKQLKHFMTSMGEKLTPEEAEAMVKAAGGGDVDYDEFVNVLLSAGEK
eukprot:TRINITY_DN5179_c0_g1_i1.p1 TRINITY_DN5179_c0_g1~~TRINITY_DN5179_c0_g1_i1.p1  ORF type:complete len:148 (-),score=46.24 TRINITY_DN5179_c0_g1_i1:48-491(-)